MPESTSPINQFGGILKGGGWSTWRRSSHAHLIREAEAMNEAANFMKRGILKSSKWPWSLDKRVAARKVTRPMFKASELLYSTAACMVVAGREYNGAFGQAPQKAEDFDPTSKS